MENESRAATMAQCVERRSVVAEETRKAIAIRMLLGNIERLIADKCTTTHSRVRIHDLASIAELCRKDELRESQVPSR